jgi:hypothetical protein
VDTSDRIDRAGVTIKIILLLALLIVFNVLPNYFGIFVFSGDDVVIITPGHLGLRLPVAMLNLWWIFALIQNIFLLRAGRWTRETRWIRFGLGLYGAWILWWILRENGDLFRGGIYIPNIPTPQVGRILGRVIQLSLAIALVMALVASFRRYRLLGIDHATLLTTAAAGTVGERRWGDFEKNLRRDLKDVYEFYLDDEERERLSKMGAVSRGAHLVVWVFKSMYQKLTPARRVLLLVALIISTVSIDLGVGNINVRSLGFVILLVILLLELKDKLVATDELAVGRAVQIAMLPRDNPVVSGWEIWLYTHPANEVGGDLVDYIKMDSDRWGIAIGDVAGKGLGAAMLMSKLQATLRALAPGFQELSDLGSEVNRIIYRDGLRNRFASMVYFELGPDSGKLRILNAGHLPPLILRKSSIEEMPRGGPAFGLLTETTYQEQGVELQKGEILVAYSDGLSEAISPDGEFFGDARLSQLLSGLKDLPVETIGERVLSEVDKFQGDAPPFDDLSLVLLRRTR